MPAGKAAIFSWGRICGMWHVFICSMWRILKWFLVGCKHVTSPSTSLENVLFMHVKSQFLTNQSRDERWQRTSSKRWPTCEFEHRQSPLFAFLLWQREANQPHSRELWSWIHYHTEHKFFSSCRVKWKQQPFDLIWCKHLVARQACSKHCAAHHVVC